MVGVDLSRAQWKMGELVQEVMAEVSASARGRVIEWQLDPLPTVYADRPMLKQVWRNLLGNAVKYTQGRDRAVIHIGSTEHPDEVEFYVQDNGAGFDMNYAGRLFGLFQRLHRDDEFKGTGVGLAGVRRIIRRHGGRTWAEGKVNEGAIFHFTLGRGPIPSRRDLASSPAVAP
jgi:light-regulated signal transduction histidine kinase (bacteriophytochrome)